MSQIRVIYHGHEPPFPATDQQPDARRFYVWPDDSITAAVDENDEEKSDIDGAAAAAKIADQALGVAVRAAEGLRRDGTDDAAAIEDLAKAEAALDAAEIMRLSAGRMQALIMDDTQRRFLAQITGDARADFIAATSKQRRELIQALPRPVLVLDVIDGPPSKAEIDAVLYPPVVIVSPIEKLTAFLQANPDVQELISIKG